MKRTLSVAATITLLAATLGAQANVYAPADSNPNTGPCNTIPMDRTEARYQTIISSSYLPRLPVKIVDIAFAPCARSRFSASQMQVRICHTTLNDFTNARTFGSNIEPWSTDLINGPFNWGTTPGQWSPLRTPCDFGYDGQRNLLIDIRFFGGAGGVACRRDSILPRLHATGPGAYSNIATGTADRAGLKMQISWVSSCVLLTADRVGLGQPLTLQLSNAPGRTNYQLAASLGQRPVDLGPCTLCLSQDSVFFASILVGAPVFNNYRGVVNSSGVRAQFACPRIRSLIGLTVYHAGVTYQRGAIQCCTNTVGTRIIP